MLHVWMGRAYVTQAPRFPPVDIVTTTRTRQDTPTLRMPTTYQAVITSGKLTMDTVPEQRRNKINIFPKLAREGPDIEGQL